MEAEETTAAGSTFTNVTFATAFAATPVVVVLTTNQGGDPSILRIRNVTSAGFEVAAVEPPGNDGPHAAITFHYVAMTPGIHALPSGEIVVAGTHTTSTVQRSPGVGGPSGLDTVNFGVTLGTTANVVASLQTMNSESGAVPTSPSMPWLSVVMQDRTSSSVSVALERSEVDEGTVQPETIGYIAFPDASSGSFDDDSGATISWSAMTTPNNIVGFNNNCVANTFSSTAFAAARVVAGKVTRNGGDGGWLRRCSLTATRIGLQVDEDISNDGERNHIAETASLLAFSGSFHATINVALNAMLNAVKTVEIIEDPVNGLTDPYAIPAGRARYSIDIESSGKLPADTNTVSFVDPIPTETSLVINDISGPGSGPILFSDGTPASNLTYTFSSLASTTDDIDFSNDNGVTFSYTPTPNTDRTDPAVTHIRVRPQGSFAVNASGTAPNFRLQFDTIID